MALRGNLKELSLPDIFQLVTFSGKTGVLRIRRGDGAQGSVWFRDGDVFFAQSNWRTEPLGERLVRAQRITPMALGRALELRELEPEGGKRLGQILIDQGYITDKVLEAFVQEQMQDTIFDLMRWDEGSFEFEAMPDAPEEDIGLAVSIENVIMEGSRRLDEWNRIKKKIPSTDIVFKMATAPGEGTFEISLKPVEWNLLLLVDGTRSVSGLAVETNRTDFEVARIIYGLFSAGLLEFAADDEVVALRAEREEREAKAAEIEKKRPAKKAPAEKPAPKPAAKPSASKAAPVAPEPQAAEPRTAPPVAKATEVPEFLGGGPQPATADDLAALEAAMGAVLEHAAERIAPAEEPKVAYTPGEEPAFIAASQEDQSGEAVPSVEEILGDIVDLAPPVEVEPEPEVVAQPEPELTPVPQPEPVAEPEIAVEPEPEAVLVAEPEPAAALEPEATPEPEAALAPEPVLIPEPEPAPAPDLTPTPEADFVFEPEPAAEPDVQMQPEPASPVGSEFVAEIVAEPASLEEHELAPDLRSVADALEEPADESDLVLEPGTFVVIPAATEPATGDGESAVVEVEPLDYVVPEVISPQEPEAPPVAEAPIAADVASQEATTPAAEVPAPPPVPGVADFEHDLMALGLGELPAELLEPSPAEAAAPEVAPAAEPSGSEFDLEPVVEPMGVNGSPSPEPEIVDAEFASQDEVDFSDLLESLDISADDARATVAPSIESEPEPSEASNPFLEAPPASPAGVISTDAFLDDLSLENDFNLSGELTDELSALTGADRPMRPSASVRHLPAEGESLLRRDMRVDRETLLKVIDGIKNL